MKLINLNETNIDIIIHDILEADISKLFEIQDGRMFLKSFDEMPKWSKYFLKNITFDQFGEMKSISFSCDIYQAIIKILLTNQSNEKTITDLGNILKNARKRIKKKAEGC